MAGSTTAKKKTNTTKKITSNKTAIAKKIVSKPSKIDLSSEEKITGFIETERTIQNIQDLFESLSSKEKIRVLELIGVGSKYYTCQHCDHVYKKTDFYVSTASYCVSGITDICKQCASDIAIPTVDGEKQQPSKESVDNALYALDKPFLDSVWDASLLEAANQASGNKRNNVWTSYIKNIQMQNYYTMTYRQSDNYSGGANILIEKTDLLPKDQEIIEQFEKNKNDTLRLIGYLPFEKEKLSDQPFLYAQLVGFQDSSEESNNDMMRTSSIISIVRGFLQESQIDDMIADLYKDPRNLEKNIATVKSLLAMKYDITQSITKLAEQSCISLKHSKTTTKGENSWTGKLKKIRDLNLRDYSINGYDIETCKGMQQVADISMNSIIKSLNLDESEYSDMISQQTKKIRELDLKMKGYEEASRILLQENLDLRDSLKLHDLLEEDNLIDLNNIVNSYFRNGDVDNV